jgi:glycosyltransferase involved in cell wall biosynthesis
VNERAGPPCRVTLLTEIPAPYRIPQFNALAALPDIELEVVFLAQRDPRRAYSVHRDEFRFSDRTLSGPGIAIRGRWLVLSRGLGRELARTTPDVVIIGGWNQPAFWSALVRARRSGTPVVAWVESTARDARPGLRALDAAKQVLIRRCTAFVVPGRASAAYLEELDVGSDRIVVAPNAVDLAIFAEGVAEARRDRDELRHRLGLTRPTLLYVGRLDREKGLDILLDAVRTLDADVVLVGDGGEAQRLRLAAPPNVRFAGWLDRDELVPWYAAADVFVLPSLSEPWGMVLNEAAAAALPIVATTAAGAAFELVEDGVSGFVVPPGDPTALADALLRLVSDAELRERAGRRSAELAERHRPERWAAEVANVVRRLASPKYPEA